MTGEMRREGDDSQSDNEDMDDNSQINSRNRVEGGTKANDELFYDANDGDDNDQDDVDDASDEDLIDDDMIDEEARIEKEAIEKAASFDSESNESPLMNQKKIRSLRHAQTLAADGHDQNLEGEARAKQS